MVAAEVKPGGNLRVNPADRLLLAKLAGLRDVSMAGLFAAPEVQRFFRGLLAAELAKESKALAGSKS